MPKPEAGESRDEFVSRCIAEMLDSGESDDRDEAEDTCALIWSQSRSAEGRAMKIVRKVHADNNSGMDYVLSDGAVDRMNDCIEPSGWLLENFKKNSVALFNHDRNAIIGRWSHVAVRGDKLVGTLELAEPGTSPLVDTVRALCSQGILRAVSVGFKALASEPRPDGGVRFTRQELLEASLVSVPAHPGALAIAKGLGISDTVRRLVFTESDSAQRERTKRARELRARSYQLLNDPAYFAHLRKRDPAGAADLERRIRAFGLTPRTK
jgi:HK97 family phage prohead protease